MPDSKNIILSKINIQKLKDKTINADKMNQKINELEREMKDLHLTQKLK